MNRSIFSCLQSKSRCVFCLHASCLHIASHHNRALRGALKMFFIWSLWTRERNFLYNLLLRHFWGVIFRGDRARYVDATHLDFPSIMTPNSLSLVNNLSHAPPVSPELRWRSNKVWNWCLEGLAGGTHQITTCIDCTSMQSSIDWEVSVYVQSSACFVKCEDWASLQYTCQQYVFIFATAYKG